MTQSNRTIMMFAGMAALLALVGFGQGWDISLLLLNMCIISAIMALGVNIQWGYAGLFSIGSMGFAALGGLAGVIVSAKPVPGESAARSSVSTGVESCSGRCTRRRWPRTPPPIARW